MKTILLLHDEAKEPRQLLGKALADNVPPEPEAVAGCNCDRWGHPCSGCVQRIAKAGPELPISMPTTK